jgi:hypothetical protein
MCGVCVVDGKGERRGRGIIVRESKRQRAEESETAGTRTHPHA